MKETEGDLIQMGSQGKFDVIVHGCNCQGRMGAGIAKQMAKDFPIAYAVDRASLYIPNRLGHFTYVTTKNTLSGEPLTIVNAYTQETPGKTFVGNDPDYSPIRNVFKEIKKAFQFKKDGTLNRIAYPLIGAGLAGGDWKIISQIIDEELEGCDHTVVIFL